MEQENLYEYSEGKVIKRDGSWYVYSKTGRKLGGPYTSRERAVKRMKQVEHFKNNK